MIVRGVLTPGQLMLAGQIHEAARRLLECIEQGLAPDTSIAIAALAGMKPASKRLRQLYDAWDELAAEEAATS